MGKKPRTEKLKKDSRAFCFCVGELVDCLPGVVLDCNNKRTRKCPLLEEKKEIVPDGEKEEKPEKDSRAFCFCLGEQVDCLPGVVLDCNNKRTRRCPLLEEETEVKRPKSADKNRKKDNRAFCFCMGTQVDCLPGVVLDCNNKRTKECPLVKEVLQVNEEKEEQVRELKEKFKHKQDSTKMDNKKRDNRKKDNRAFCFCMGTQVDCLPGVVLDCNNKRTKECPLVKEVLQVNEEKEEQVKELKEKYKSKKSNKKKDSNKKDNRAFCFCVGAQVDCLPGVVLDCNNKRTKICPLETE